MEIGFDFEKQQGGGVLPESIWKVLKLICCYFGTDLAPVCDDRGGVECQERSSAVGAALETSEKLSLVLEIGSIQQIGGS